MKGLDMPPSAYRTARRLTTCVATLFVSLSATAGAVGVTNPSRSGPHAVVRADYDLGDRAHRLQDSEQDVELRAAVYLPADTGQPAPVVILVHGSHPVCYNERHALGRYIWPCPSGYRPLPNYLGYEGPASSLASHGYAVVSVSVNGILANNSDEPFIHEEWQMAELVLAHLDLLASANHGSVVSMASLKGRLDLGRIGVLGHSRGAEGAARTVLRNAQREHPYNIAALFLLTPPSFRPAVPDVPTATMLSYCDGDRSLDGQIHFEASRHAFGDDVLRTAVLLMGANHNFYNTVWTPPFVGGVDDAESVDLGVGCAAGKRLSARTQYDLGSAYIAGFFRLTLGQERAFLPMFDGSSVYIHGLPGFDARTTASFPASSRLDLRNFDRGEGGDSAETAWSWQASGHARIEDCFDELDRVDAFNLSTALCWPQGATPRRASALLTAPSPVDASAYTHLSVRVTRTGRRDMWMAATFRGSSNLPVTRYESGGALAALPQVSTPLRYDRAPFDLAVPQQVTVPLEGIKREVLHGLRSVHLQFSPGGGALAIDDISLVTPNVGVGKVSERPVVSIFPLEVEPAKAIRDIPFHVRLTRPAEGPVSARVILIGNETFATRTVRFEAGEQEKPVTLRIEANAAPASCQATLRVLEGNAFHGRDNVRLRIRGDGDHALSDCSGFSFVN